MPSNYVPIDLSNHGLCWSAGQLRQLKRLMDQNKSVESVAFTMKRTVGTCERMYREIRRMKLLRSTDPSATLISIRKEKET